jgi:NTP pyrophosphatase (non-canonical NTP hydrolase)
MTYYIYHIPGKKIGVTRDLEERVTNQQGYGPDEYEILGEYINIDDVSSMERMLQKEYGYKVDRIPYNKLKCNKMKMKINVTEQTTTFPCPVNKLKGQLMDCIGMQWETEFGDCIITNKSIKWIMKNVKESMYNNERSYIYNKAFSRWFDNNDVFSEKDVMDQYGGKTIAGALEPSSYREEQEEDCGCDKSDWNIFDYIRDWADERGLYDKGDTKTQALKLVEEVGEVCRAILKDDGPEIEYGIGDCVVVLTNLAELHGIRIEYCIDAAYNEIKNRKGKMANGTYVKND